MQKRSRDFDNILKGKLKMLAPDLNPGDWIMMERLLQQAGLSHDAEDLGEIQFDEVTIDKLQNISTTNLIPDWDRMASMLDNAVEEPSMEPSELDQAIKNKIQDTSAPFQSAIWDQMQPVLEADQERLVAEMDYVTRDKLTQVTDIEGAWSSMNSKINRELFLPESIVKYKVLEVGVVLLFLLSLWQMPFDQIRNSASNQVATSDAPKVVISKHDEINIEEISSALSISKAQSLTDAQTTIVEENIIIKKTDSAPELAISNKPTSTTDNQEIIEQVLLYNPVLPPSLPQLLKELSEWEGPRISAEAVAQAILGKNNGGYDAPSFSILANLQPLSKALIAADPEQRDNVENLTLEPLDVIPGELALLELADDPFGRKCILCSEDTKRLGLVLSVFTGSDFNQIVTPFDPIYAEEGTTQWNAGYGGGVALGVTFKNWELETGAIYASNQYEPRPIFDITGSLTSGYVSSTLTDIQLDVVKIPLNFRFNVNLWEKWKIYALSGATINMVMLADFNTRDVPLGTKSFLTPTSTAFSTSSLALKDFGGGLLEGGSFDRNSYFTANLGFGVERTLNERVSVFAQPTYQRQIFTSGIGPNQDRFNAVSLFLGLRTSIR